MSNPDRRRVHLRDVAKSAGVSVGSASQAFGRPELVSEATRKRVLAAAQALGYPGPDPAARRLRMGRAGAVGLIFAERLAYQFTDPASPAFLRGVALGMEEAPTGLLLIPDSRDREKTARTVSEAVVDGFLIYSTPQNDPRVEAALARRLPVSRPLDDQVIDRQHAALLSMSATLATSALRCSRSSRHSIPLERSSST